MGKNFIKLISLFILTIFFFSSLFFLKPKTFSKSFEPNPIFVDSFENKVNTENTLTSPYYKEKVNSTNKISFIEGKKGMGVHLDSLSSYVGYSSKYINPEEGTIRFYYKPDRNIYDFYNTRQPEWKDFGSYKQPFTGYLIDSVGFLRAFSGGFSSSISFSGDKNNKNIIMSFGTWSGSNWSYAEYETKNDFVLSSNSFYDIALTWSKKEGKIKIFIDGVLKGSSNYNTSLNNNEIFFIGHNPFQNYWPYGPHSLIGTYDELKIYNVALNSFTDETLPTPPSGSCDLFSDDFERTSIGANWTIVDDESSSKSNWHITSGSLIQDSNIYRINREYEYFQGTHIITGNSNWSDYTVSFEVTPTDDDGVGALFRYQDKNNYYRFIMIRDSTNKGPFRRIDKIVNGEPFQVLSIDNKNSFEINKKYKISIKVYGSSINVYMDGVEILRAVDSTYKSGKIGFMTYASYASFDNLCVSTFTDNKKEDQADCTWTGTWDTNWGKMYLIQSGSKVSGNYEYNNGKIEGIVSGNILSGTWSESPSYLPPNDAGDFEFTMSSDCNSFIGKWRYPNGSWYENDWKGTRLSDIVPSQNPNKPPRGLRAYPGNNKVYLEWDEPEDTKNLLGYYIYRAKVSGGYSSPAHDFYITNTNYLDENVENGTTYYYICKVVYNDKSQSPPSNEVMVTPKPLSPVINISDNQKVTNSKFTFTGKVDPGSEVYVNGNKVDVDSNGNFTATVTLVKGTNTIKIEVKNKAKDTITITKTVIYEETTTPPTPPSGTLTIILQINNPQMIVNGVKKEIDPGRGTVPVIVKGRTLVPIRAIIEEMGGEISWDGTERKVTIKLKGTTIELWIDKKSAKVNGVVKELDVPPQIINGRTMLPLRFVTEELGCTVDWDGTTKTITITYKKEQTNLNEDINKISGEGEKIFGPSGGELTLSDGTKLVVSSNAFSKDSKITLKSIINPSFYSQDALGFEITGLKELKGDITLYANGPKGLKNDELNIFGYDHESDEKIDLNYSYDSNSGIVSIKISPSTLLLNKKNFLLSNYVIQSYSKILGFKDKLALYIGWISDYNPKNDEKIIRMPYYEQIGGSCASTCAQMLLKYSGNDIELFDLLKELKARDTDFGLSPDTFANNLRDFISRRTGFSVIHIPYFAIEHLKWKILSELDKGHPVILNWGKHVVLVLGYKGRGNEIIIHDPQNISPANNENGTMYTVRNWDWIKGRHKYSTEKYYIIYSDGTFPSSPSLSLMCPGNDETYAMSGGEISFYITHPNTKKLTPFYELQIKPSEQSNGYIWLNAQTKEKIDSIQQDAEVLKLKLYAYNGSVYAKDIEIQTAIKEDKGEISPGKKISSHNQKFSISEAKFDNATKVVYEYEYKVEDLRDYSISDKDGKEKILIYAYLWEDTSLRDSFIIKATLNILPKVTSINPTTGKSGDTITINGFSFGKNKTTKSRVMIGNKEVEIISWSDKEIKVKLPQDIESGPVVVYTGEKYEYESNKDVLFGEPYEGSYAFNILHDEIDCSICNFPDNLTNKSGIKITLKDGKIKMSGITLTDKFIWDGDGVYDKNGNVKINFTGICNYWSLNGRLIVKGTVTGKIIENPQNVNIGGTIKFDGKINQKCIREINETDINKLKIICCENKPYIEKEYTFELKELTKWW